MPTTTLISLLDDLLRTGLPVLRTTIRVGRATVQIAVRILFGADGR